MACYIVAFEIQNGSKINLEIAIRSYPNWAHVADCVWAVSSPASTVNATTIRDNLSRHINAGDRLFVIKSGVEAAWRNSLCDNQWLKDNL